MYNFGKLRNILNSKVRGILLFTYFPSLWLSFDVLSVLTEGRVNNRVLKNVLVAALMCGVPLAAVGADKNGRFGIKGAGTASCERYLEERGKRSEPYYLIAGWVNGYITAANLYEKDTYDLLAWQDSKLINALLETHCKKHPKQQIHLSVRSMVEQLKKSRLREMDVLVEAKADKNSIRLYRDTLRRVQTKLVEQGFYKGGVDGKFGLGTKKALEVFQLKHKLKKTGLPDQTTLYALFVILAEK